MVENKTSKRSKPHVVRMAQYVIRHSTMFNIAISLHIEASNVRPVIHSTKQRLFSIPISASHINKHTKITRSATDCISKTPVF